MSAEGIKIKNDDDDNERYRTEGARSEDFSDSKAPMNSEELSASAHKIDRESEEGQNQGSGEQLVSGEGNTRNAEFTPDAPVDAPKPQVDFVDEDDDDEPDDSDEDDFPRNEDNPRGRIVVPVAGQRPTKPR